MEWCPEDRYYQQTDKECQILYGRTYKEAFPVDPTWDQLVKSYKDLNLTITRNLIEDGKYDYQCKGKWLGRASSEPILCFILNRSLQTERIVHLRNRIKEFELYYKSLHNHELR